MTATMSRRSTRRVRMNCCQAGELFVRYPGKDYDIPADEAARMIEAGQCTPIEEVGEATASDVGLTNEKLEALAAAVAARLAAPQANAEVGEDVLDQLVDRVLAKVEERMKPPADVETAERDRGEVETAAKTPLKKTPPNKLLKNARPPADDDAADK